jgi:hypothetical protein
MIRTIDRHHGALNLVGETGVVIEPLRHVFRLRDHLGNELAVVAHLDFAEVLGVLLDQLGDPAHDLGARSRRHLRPSPALEGQVGGVDCAIHVRLVAFRNQRPRRSRVRIKGLECLAGDGIGPSPIDESLVALERSRTIQHDDLLLVGVLLVGVQS